MKLSQVSNLSSSSLGKKSGSNVRGWKENKSYRGLSNVGTWSSVCLQQVSHPPLNIGGIFNIFFTIVWEGVGIFVSIFSFFTFIYLGNELTVSVAFTVSNWMMGMCSH